jgi:hypothetical protein
MSNNNLPFPIIGIVHADAIIHSIPLSHILFFGPIRKLPQQGILRIFKKALLQSGSKGQTQ